MKVKLIKIKQNKMVRGNYHVLEMQKEKVYRLSKVGSRINKTGVKMSESEVIRALIDNQKE